MKENNLEKLEHIISLYLKDLTLYMYDRSIKTTNRVIGYVYRKNTLVGIFTISLDTSYCYLTVNSPVASTLLNLMGFTFWDRDFEGYGDNKYNLKAILKEFFVNKINEYYLEDRGYNLTNKYNFDLTLSSLPDVPINNIKDMEKINIH